VYVEVLFVNRASMIHNEAKDFVFLNEAQSNNVEFLPADDEAHLWSSRN
jgi:hypothetical protein